MSANLEYRNGQYSFAFTGPRTAIWHRTGNQLPNDATRDQWLDAAGFRYTVLKSPAFAQFKGEMVPADWVFLQREDNGHIFASAKPEYQLDNLQPANVFDFFDRYILLCPGFSMCRAGVLGNGGRLWAQARYDKDLTIADERVVPHLLLSTSYDLSASTTAQGTTVSVVCQNTLAAAHSDKRAMIKVTHRSKFNPDAVIEELAGIMKGFETFKAMGEQLAMHAMSVETVGRFFAKLLGANLDKPDEVSARKANQLQTLAAAYNQSKEERNTHADNAWLALQAVTRYCDHDRNSRGQNGNAEMARFDSATFGSGNQLKRDAVQLLTQNAQIKLYA